MEVRKMVLLWLSLLLLWSVGVSAQSKEAVIEKYLEAIGGKEKWASVLTKVDSSILVTLSRSEVIDSSSDTIKLVTRFLRPNLQRIDQSGKGLANVTCFDGTVLWTKTGDGATNIQSREQAHYFRSTVFLGFGDLLVEKSTLISFEGVAVLDGKRCNVLSVKRNEWLLPHKYYFDKESGLLYCVASLESATKRRTYLKDYRSVMGILWAHAEEAYVGDELVDIAVHKRILLNIAIDKSVFNP